jgi:hypothetical protein
VCAKGITCQISKTTKASDLTRVSLKPEQKVMGKLIKYKLKGNLGLGGNPHLEPWDLKLFEPK